MFLTLAGGFAPREGGAAQGATKLLWRYPQLREGAEAVDQTVRPCTVSRPAITVYLCPVTRVSDSHG